MVDGSGRPSEPVPRERGQIVVLGAIALAVVVFGIVVMVGGSEVGSSTAPGADTGEQAVVEAELEYGIGCLLENANERTDEERLEAAAADDLEAFTDRYRDARAHSTGTLVDVELEDVGLERVGGEDELENATVRVTADSADRRTKRMLTIEAGCPEGEP
ncbi:hypothetical protein [Natronococcus sp. A-GB7]|uniref:hypothetical protein n=1 Tax=Natronococcus sp. A-GB7 TaxID=3037649 RepID=UPI00241EFBDA|nr:hypothetical protein [Natronococcus sp. A-GB7]MDG5820346.1 hypothetical protein [Natronococcus sp. A-GB7]